MQRKYVNLEVMKVILIVVLKI